MGWMDYHLHTNLSVDSNGDLRAMCRRAVELGLSEICFTEHYDVDPYDRGYAFYDDALATDRLAAAREEFAGRLVIRKGLEFDFQSRHAHGLAERLAQWKFDFLIGSVHNVYGDMVRVAIERRRFPPDEVYREYFAEVMALIRTGLPHVLGHLDYVRKVSPDLLADYRFADYDARMRDVVAMLVDAGIGLEVNSRYQERGQPVVPGLDVLRMYHGAGGRIVTLGSDGHAAAGVGAGLADSRNLLVEAGFGEYMAFDSGRPVPQPLPVDVPASLAAARA